MLAIYKLRCKKFFAAVFYSPSATTFREKIPPRLTRKDAMLPCTIPSLLPDVALEGGQPNAFAFAQIFLPHLSAPPVDSTKPTTPPEPTRESMAKSRSQQGGKFQWEVVRTPNKERTTCALKTSSPGETSDLAWTDFEHSRRVGP